MLTTTDIERLLLLITVANYDGDAELQSKLQALLNRERGRAFANRLDDSRKEIPIDGKRRSS